MIVKIASANGDCDLAYVDSTHLFCRYPSASSRYVDSFSMQWIVNNAQRIPWSSTDCSLLMKRDWNLAEAPTQQSLRWTTKVCAVLERRSTAFSTKDKWIT